MVIKDMVIPIKYTKRSMSQNVLKLIWLVKSKKINVKKPTNSIIGAINSKNKAYGKTTIPILPYFLLNKNLRCTTKICKRPLTQRVLCLFKTFKVGGPSVQQQVSGICTILYFRLFSLIRATILNVMSISSATV